MIYSVRASCFVEISWHSCDNPRKVRCAFGHILLNFLFFGFVHRGQAGRWKIYIADTVRYGQWLVFDHHVRHRAHESNEFCVLSEYQRHGLSTDDELFDKR